MVVHQRGSSISLEGMSCHYGGDGGVSQIHLDIASGSQLAIVGASGSGKSTLLRLIAGLEAGNEGSLTIDGQLASQAGRILMEPNRRHVGMVFQDFALFPHMTALENVGFAAHLQARHVQRQRAEELLQRVGLNHRLHAKPSELSGGEQQRVALARALAGNPKILLLDEPYSSLDARLRDDLASMTRKIVRELGVTAILVSHDGDEALRFADRVAFMQHGRLLFDGAMADLKERSVPPDLLQLLFPLTGVTLRHDGGANLTTPWGQNLALPLDLQPPGSVQLFTIPGAASIIEDDSGTLKVLDNHDLGLTREMLLALPDGQEFRLQDVRSVAAMGARVSLSLDPERLFLFRSSS